MQSKIYSLEIVWRAKNWRKCKWRGRNRWNPYKSNIKKQFHETISFNGTIIVNEVILEKKNFWIVQMMEDSHGTKLH